MNTITGEELLAMSKKYGIEIEVVSAQFLFKNSATLLVPHDVSKKPRLSVSLAVYACIVDPDTALEAIKSLSIVIIPPKPRFMTVNWADLPKF